MLIHWALLGALGANPTQFCQGFIAGYGDGWCGKTSLECQPPTPNQCPSPKEWEKHSYYAGFERGRERGHAADLDMSAHAVKPMESK